MSVEQLLVVLAFFLFPFSFTVDAGSSDSGRLDAVGSTTDTSCCCAAIMTGGLRPLHASQRLFSAELRSVHVGHVQEEEVVDDDDDDI